MTPLDRNFAAMVALRAHLSASLPDADVRVWRVTNHSVQVHVGPEVGAWSDFEVRPELHRVALAIDPMCRWAFTDNGSYVTYRWNCVFDGVKVIVKGEGKGEPHAAPKPLPEPRAVAA